MSVSLYDLTIPVAKRGFAVLSTYLDRAEAFAAEQGLAPSELLDAKLAPDMLTLVGQVQRASDAVKAAVVRVGGVENVRFEDTETTFDDLRARIAKTVAFLDGVTPAQMNAGEGRVIEVKFVGASLTAEQFLLAIFLPNFYFHVTTAHDILRHKGLAIGKKDYWGRFD